MQRVPSALIQGVYEQCADAGVLGHGHRPEHGVLQQGGSQLEPLRTFCDREPAQHQYRNGVWHVAAHAPGRALVGDCSCSQGAGKLVH